MNLNFQRGNDSIQNELIEDLNRELILDAKRSNSSLSSANYKYAFASMYHTNKLSDIYWLYTYPQNVMLSASLHFHLW